jgi:Leucine-rich repeat (LRR) protein
MVMNPKMFIYLPLACVFGLIYRFFNAPQKPSPTTQSPPKQVVYMLGSADSTLEIAEQRYAETYYSQAFVLYNEYSNHSSFKGLHMRHFAMLHQWGKGCVADTAKAIHWYKEAVRNGDAEAQSYLQALNYTQSKIAHLITELDSTTTILDLSGDTTLTSFETILKYKQLKTIALRNCKLTNLPLVIGQMAQLEDLYLDGNSLKTLPIEISNLTNLKTLHLMNNQLISLPNELRKLTKLQYLDVSNNKMTAFPSAILPLNQLSWLALEGNAIKQLPENIGNLKQLVQLNLTSNQLKTLPKALFQLTKLEVLYVNNNQLTKFYTEVKQLINLKYLYLDHNQLKQLPDVLCQMKFNQLNLSQNPYEIVPSCLR